MRKAMLLFAVILVPAALGWTPENIIVKYDYSTGGNYITDALEELWPDAYIRTFNGNNWQSFTSTLQGSAWDMCVVAAIESSSFDIVDYQALTDYYNEYGKLFYFDWNASSHSYNDILETAMGVGNPTSMGFTSSHYVWDADHPIVQGIDSWLLETHGWDLIVYHDRYPWTSATPVTGWTSSQTAGQAGILVAENRFSVISGLYASFIGYSQEKELWENIFSFIWTGGMTPPYVDGLNPDDGDSGVPVETDVSFHCRHDSTPIDTTTIRFTLEYVDRGAPGGGKYVSACAAPGPLRGIDGSLDIDDGDPLDVICTFDTDEDLEPFCELKCRVDGGLATILDSIMGDDFVWHFYTEGYGVERTTWGAIKAEF